MAVGEPKQLGNISEVSWTGGTALDVYYGTEHSFQYSENINCDDEMHGIKLSTRPGFTSQYRKCQLVSLGEHGVMALPVGGETGDTSWLKRLQYNGYYVGFEELDDKAGTALSLTLDTRSGTVFQDRFWFGSNVGSTNPPKGLIHSVPLSVTAPGHGYDDQKVYYPYDHLDYTDESISDEGQINGECMSNGITAILNYNNARLVVADGPSVWVYYPELDKMNPLSPIYDGSLPESERGKTGWKKVLNYENGVTIVGLTCTFEYLKVRAVDEGWNTQIYFYQGNNNLRNTFVYNLIDLTGVRVLHVYSVNGTDYYTSSIGRDNQTSLIDFNKLNGATPLKLFSQRAGLDPLDINTKAPYFVGPTSLSAAYNNGYFYIADAYGVFSFKFERSTRYTAGYDKGYMKRRLNNQPTQVYGVCENQGYLYISDDNGCRAIRLYNTGKDGYQEKGVLISREYEGEFGGTITKMLKEIRLNYEMNPNTEYNGSINIYVSPNNLWKSTSQFTEANNWYHVMSLGQINADTRTEKSNLLNNLGEDGKSAFEFDWQTLTYAIVITRYTPPAENATVDQQNAVKATPIVRQIDIRYQTKDKVNKVYDIN